MRTPRNSALMISSRCCSPTDKRRDRPVRIERQAELLLDALKAGKPAGAVEPAAFARQPDQQIVEHGKARREVEMLVHHADAGGERVRGGADVHRLAFDRDGARVGLVDAEQDVHQRGLAGAVLAEQPEDLAGRQHEIDVGIGADIAKALRDAAHFDEGGGRSSNVAPSRVRDQSAPSTAFAALATSPRTTGEERLATWRGSSPREAGERWPRSGR